jgi:hypothetical protein
VRFDLKPMGELRKPFFIAAVVLILLAVAVETGATWFLGGVTAKAGDMTSLLDDPAFADQMHAVNPADLQSLNKGTPPGRAIPAMAVLDGLVLFTVLLMGAPMFIPERIFAKMQGVATLVVSLIALLGSIGGIFLTFSLVMLMVALLTAFPFGTIIYLIIYGFFDRTWSNVTLSFLILLKVSFAACLILAHPRFIQNKGLVLIVLTSLAANIIISFSHAMVPRPLVSITDAIAAILVFVLVVLWAVFFLVGSIVAVVKAVA